MISKISEKAVNFLFKSNDASEDEIELYNYGFFILLSRLFFVLITFITGLVCGIVLESLVFYFSFSLIRAYAGGIHAKSENVCTFYTSLFIVVSVLLIKICLLFDLLHLMLIITPVAVICIIALSPLESESKPLTKTERTLYRKKSLIVLAVIEACSCAALLISASSLFYSFTIAITLEALLLSLGKAQAMLH